MEIRFSYKILEMAFDSDCKQLEKNMQEVTEGSCKIELESIWQVGMSENITHVIILESNPDWWQMDSDWKLQKYYRILERDFFDNRENLISIHPVRRRAQRDCTVTSLGNWPQVLMKKWESRTQFKIIGLDESQLI